MLVNSRENAIPRRLGGGEAIPFEVLNENPSATLSGKNLRSHEPESSISIMCMLSKKHNVSPTKVASFSLELAQLF